MVKDLKKVKTDQIKPREITEEMRESYLDYAMSVIVSRALPDVRDGLKPVHRRILYAMLEDGLRNNARFRKSATVVGSTMARYHPHGDAAIYDSLTRMAQDFSLRYPLIQGQGNFGSIDGDSAAAYRYCITGDSLLVTNRCLERIEKISDKENIEDLNLEVLSFDNKIHSASKWFDSGIHQVLRIETFRGYHLTGTKNHPVLTLQKNADNKPVFRWKIMDEIGDGDFVVIDRNNQTLWHKEEPDLKPYYPETKNRRSIVHQLPSLMNSDLAFLMGAIVADGYVSHKKRAKCVGFCNTDKDFINAFKESFKTVFPSCRLHEFERDPVGYGKKKFVSLEIHSTYITEFLENLGLKKSLSSEKKIPEILFDASKDSLSAFIKGFTEGDGSIFVSYYPTKENKKRKTIELALISTSERLLRELQIVLLRFGIVSFLRFDKKKKTWRLLIRGYDNLVLFKEQIGFVSSKKQKKLNECTSFNADFTIMSKTDFIPFLSGYLREKYKSTKHRVWLNKHNLDRYPKIRKYLKALKEILSSEDLELINKFLLQEYLFDKVTSIKEDGQKRVYSLKIDSKCHSFVSNGFISHNTEARLSKIGEEILKDIEKETVDFIDNYDGTRKEPTVLPSPVPQLLLNGSLGIAVGMATNIPPHNLLEVCDALIYLLDNPKATTEDLFQFVKGPDFPTGGEIFNKKDILHAYSVGKGPIVARGKAIITDAENEKKKQIIITEIPYQVQKSSLVEKFAELVQNKKIKGIKDIRDESDKDGMRIAIDLQRGANAKQILNRLYKFSNLQKTFHLNMLALVDGIQPKVLPLLDFLDYFLLHRKEVVKRRTKYNLEKAKERAHILEGLAKCLSKIDEVIKVIKKSIDRQDAHKNLKKKFKLTDIQANAILETKLSALAKLERSKIQDELKELKAKIQELSSILKSQTKIKRVIKKELNSLKQEFGDPRKTKVNAHQVGEFTLKDLIPQEQAIITVTQGGYVKRLNPSTYKIQHRGGKGILGMKTVGEDIIEHFILANTHDSLLFFTDYGKVFQVPAYEIPEASRVAKGRGLLNFLELSSQEKVLSIFALEKDKKQLENRCLVMVTRDGIIKKTKLEKFSNVRRSGLKAISLKRGDSLQKVKMTEGNDEIILVTKKGQSIRFKEKDVRSMGRTAAGVKGIRMKKEDEIVGMQIIKAKKEKSKTKIKEYLLIVMENGYGKRTDLKEYRSQGRGGSGIKTANITAKTGEIVSSKILTEEKDLIAISQKGQVIRTKIAQISKLSRATQGVRIMRLKEEDKVVSVICI